MSSNLVERVVLINHLKGPGNHQTQVDTMLIGGCNHVVDNFPVGWIGGVRVVIKERIGTPRRLKPEKIEVDPGGVESFAGRIGQIEFTVCGAIYSQAPRGVPHPEKGRSIGLHEGPSIRTDFQAW